MQIKNVIFDYDGVFTDGKCILDNNKFTNKINIKDITGLRMLKENGYRIFIINSFKGKNSFKDYVKYVDCFEGGSKGNSNKLDIFIKWMVKYNLTFENTAVIGDDLVDLPLIEKCGFSACPSDAADEVKDMVDYICVKKGGDGCVREFCEYLIKGQHPIVDALVCVKMNSSRLPFKNVCKFGNTTLLENKLDILLSLNFLNSVVLNTESQEIINFISLNEKYKRFIERKKRPLVIIKRDEIYSLDSTHNSEFTKGVTNNLKHHILYSPVTMPFITRETYYNMFENIKSPKFDSIILPAHGKKGGGHEDEKHNWCFAASLMHRRDIIKHKDFIGDKPFFQQCTKKERCDIDYEYEFARALHLYFNSDADTNDIIEDNDLYKYSTNHNHSFYKSKFPSIIDVTIRDGGFVNHWDFDIDTVIRFLNLSDNIGLEYFEIGYFMDEEFVKENDKNPYRMLDVDTIKNVTSHVSLKNVKLCALIDYWRYNVDNLPLKSETGLDLIRVTTYIETTKEAIEYIKKIKSKGYEVSLNVMCGSFLTESDKDRILADVMNNVDLLDYLYIADSYGSMNPNSVKDVFSYFQPVRTYMKLGFHIHDNMQISMANFIASIGLVDIADASYSGMGRGCGNLKLEDVILYGKIKHHVRFDIIPLLEHYDYENDTNKEHIQHTIMGLLNIHPYRLRDCENLSLCDKYEYLSDLDSEKRYKFD